MSILNNSELRYHGIGENVIKLIGILEHGILCQNDSQKSTEYQKNYDGYNQSNMVSLAVATNGENTTYGAFAVFVKEGISFIIENSIGIKASNTSHDSMIPGEEFHIGSIPKDNIIGVMINEKLSKKKIRDLNLIGGMGTGFIENTLSGLLQYFCENSELDIDINEFKEMINQKNVLLEKETGVLDRMD